MESDADCNTKYNTRDYEEAFSGIVSGTNPQGVVPMTWFYKGLIFRGGDNEHVSYHSGAPVTSRVHVDFERSTYVGTTVIEAIQIIVASAQQPGTTIYSPEIFAQLEHDAMAGSTQIQASVIEADFHGAGAGSERTIDDIDWTCP